MPRTAKVSTGVARTRQRVDLAEARRALNKRMGAGTIVSLNDQSDDMPRMPSISSGVFLLDLALGNGGFPKGRLVEAFGPESSGKSTVLLSLIAQAQRLGGTAAYIDHENTFDPNYARTCGVDTSDEALILAQPTTMEEGIEVAEELIDAGVDVIGVDSLAAMVPRRELEGDIGDVHVALQARTLSPLLRRLVGKINNAGTIVMFLNHEKETIGGMPGRPAGTTTPGGKALKFYASTRIRFQMIQQVKGKVDDPVTGKAVEGTVAVKVKAKVVKNKAAAPFREATFYFRNGRGVYEPLSILEVGVGRGIIKQNGPRVVFPSADGEVINVPGVQAAVRHWEENPADYDFIRGCVMAALENTGAPVGAVEDDADGTDPEVESELPEGE